MLEYNKNYIILALNCMLKNSKGMILVSEIKKRNRNNNIKRRIEHKTSERALMNAKGYC